MITILQKINKAINKVNLCDPKSLGQGSLFVCQMLFAVSHIKISLPRDNGQYYQWAIKQYFRRSLYMKEVAWNWASETQVVCYI